MFQKIKGLVNKGIKAVVATTTAVVVACTTAVAAFAAPATGNTDVDTILTEFEGGFSVVNKGFVYLAIAGIAVTLIVVAFFWLRGKFKQTVAGA
jgi:hypothetical protein